MASLLKLKTDIKKLKAAIASKATSGAIKTKLRGKLTTLENELDKLQPNKRKPKTTGPKSESALVKLAKKRRTNQGLSTSKNDIERDAIRPAKKAGKRISANGNRYYEYRDNRVDNRQPPKKYRKLADGGDLGSDYRKKLENNIYKTALNKEVNGFKLVKLAWHNEGTLLWTNKQRPEIEIYATPFYTPDNDINFEEFINEEGRRREDKEFKLTGDIDKDTQYYFNYLESITKKYAKGKMADGGMMADKGTYVTSGFTTTDELNNTIVDKFKMQDWYEDFNDGFEKLLTKKYITQQEYEKYEEILNRVDPIDKYGEMSGRAAAKKFVDDNKRYTKMADGGELGEDYREELQEYILDKYTDEYVFGFKLTDSMGEGESPFIWKNEDKNIDVLAIPFYEDENEIHIEVYKDEDQQLQLTDRSYKIVGRKLEDAREYLKILTPLFKKYNNTTIPKKQKIQPAVDVEVLKKREKDIEISEEIADITDGYGPFIYKVGNGYEFDFEKLLQEVKAKKIQKADLDNLMRSSGTIEWKNEVLSKFGNIMSKNEREKLEKHDGRSVYMHGGYMAKGGKTKEQEVVRGYFEDEAYEYADGGEIDMDVIVKTPKGIVTKKDFEGFTKKEIIQWCEERGWVYNPKGEKLGGRILKEYEFFIKTPTKYNVTLPKKMADGGSVAKGNYEMLMSQAKEVMHHAEELMQVAKPDMDVEAWVVAKAERATTDLSDITHYLDGLKMAMGGMVKHNAHKVNA